RFPHLLGACLPRQLLGSRYTNAGRRGARTTVQDCLSLRGVGASYGTHETARLTEIDLVLSAGELVCLLGPNGAGKTTLVRVASGLLAPAQGDVTLLGAPLASRSRAETARLLAVVEQQQEPAAGF